MGLIPELGRFPAVGSGNPLQYSCLKNLMDRGAWWAIVHRVDTPELARTTPSLLEALYVVKLFSQNSALNSESWLET